MTYYDSFDCKINCEDFNQVSEDEYNEVMAMMAEENEALANLPTDDQQAWEVEQESAKDWLGNYSNVDHGKTYNGIAI
jgi:hypothetical protein